MKNRSMQIASILILICIALLAGGCGGTTAPEGSNGTPSAPQPPAMMEAGGSQVADPAITALGTLRPAQTLQLGFGASGPVKAVAVRLGTDVREGELLAELDTTALALELESAQEEVARRRAALEGLLNGPSQMLAERAEAERAQGVALAEISVQTAQWRLEQARLQDHAPMVDAARSRLQQLELRLAQASAQSHTAEVVAARIGLDRAQRALDRARTEYGKAIDRPWEPQEVRDAHAEAVLYAEQEVQLAQARVQSALEAQRAHALSLDVLESQRDEAEAQLDQALDGQAAHTVTLKLLAADVEALELQLGGLQAWENPTLDPTPPEETAQSRAFLRQAELAVEQLEHRLRGAELRAPFDGVVSAVWLSPGEWGTPGVPALELIDTTHWYVETRNVGELNIGQVQVGQVALVQVLAFQGETLQGRVATISPVAVVQQGDTTYTLAIELEPTELSLRPGMNVQVTIQTE